MNLQIIKDTILNDSIKLKEDLYKFNHQIVLNSDNNDSQLLTNGITIALALIAAFIALYQVKSNIIASSRIKWIENLREAISEYTVEVQNCATILENMIGKTKGKNNEDSYKIIENEYPSYFESSANSDILANKILLYLNSDEKEHREIEKLIKKISLHLYKKSILELNKEEIESDVEKIIVISKKIFKKEWKKSKRLFKI